ncbi:MAG: hypothetical protein Q8N55_04610 [bacterium]|nr:hypothetical protein [bacterium]
MPEENKTQPSQGLNTTEIEGAQESPNQAQEEQAPNAKVLEPGGIMILIIAAIFDILGLISAAMIAWFGIGVVMGRVVSVVGFVVIALLLKMQGSDSAAMGAAQDKVMDLIKTFLKRNKGNVIAEAIPVVGDLWPGFTLMAYKALSGN